MIYMDGSRFPFNAESTVSRSIAAALENLDQTPQEELTQRLREGIASYYKTKPEFITAGKNRRELLDRLFPGKITFVSNRWDDAAALAGSRVCELTENLHDMRADLTALLNAKKENTILLSNPCIPTSLQLTQENIEKLAENHKIIVDETYSLFGQQSAVSMVGTGKNISVLKRLPFAGEICFSVSENGQSGTDVSKEQTAAAGVVFSHPAAIRNTERKLSDSAGSLYIRIKKLAVKYKSLERLYRSRSGFVFFKTADAEKRASALYDMGFAVRCDEDFLCVFAGTQDENNAAVNALSKVLEQ